MQRCPVLPVPPFFLLRAGLNASSRPPLTFEASSLPTGGTDRFASLQAPAPGVRDDGAKSWSPKPACGDAADSTLFGHKSFQAIYRVGLRGQRAHRATSAKIFPLMAFLRGPPEHAETSLHWP
jgi:hypothetical protein